MLSKKPNCEFLTEMNKASISLMEMNSVTVADVRSAAETICFYDQSVTVDLGVLSSSSGQR